MLGLKHHTSSRRKATIYEGKPWSDDWTKVALALHLALAGKYYAGIVEKEESSWEWTFGAVWKVENWLGTLLGNAEHRLGTSKCGRVETLEDRLNSCDSLHELEFLVKMQVASFVFSRELSQIVWPGVWQHSNLSRSGLKFNEWRIWWHSLTVRFDARKSGKCREFMRVYAGIDCRIGLIVWIFAVIWRTIFMLWVSVQNCGPVGDMRRRIHSL